MHYGWHVVTSVTNADNQPLYSGEVRPEQTIERDVAIDVSYALTKVAQDGTGSRAAQLGYPVAGKTGSYYISDLRSTRAIWFVGFTRQITTSVMFVKGDKGTGNLGQNFYGSGYPALAWLDFMKAAMDGKEKLPFDPPTKRVSTQTPSAEPSETAEPSPSESPTELPTDEPTEPTAEPTQTPTAPPTTAPPTTAPPTTAPPTTAPPTTAPPTGEADG